MLVCKQLFTIFKMRRSIVTTSLFVHLDFSTNSQLYCFDNINKKYTHSRSTTYTLDLCSTGSVSKTSLSSSLRVEQNKLDCLSPGKLFSDRVQK